MAAIKLTGREGFGKRAPDANLRQQAARQLAAQDDGSGFAELIGAGLGGVTGFLVGGPAAAAAGAGLGRAAGQLVEGEPEVALRTGLGAASAAAGAPLTGMTELELIASLLE